MYLKARQFFCPYGEAIVELNEKVPKYAGSMRHDDVRACLL